MSADLVDLVRRLFPTSPDVQRAALDSIARSAADKRFTGEPPSMFGDIAPRFAVGYRGARSYATWAEAREADRGFGDYPLDMRETGDAYITGYFDAEQKAELWDEQRQDEADERDEDDEE